MTTNVAGLIRLAVAGLGSAIALVATLPVLMLGLPFWVASTLTRAIRAILLRHSSREVAWTDLIEFTPEIGWKNRGNVRARVRLARAFQVSTDGEGWRGNRSIEESDVVVFGDSFAFGHGVHDRHFFALRPSGIRVKALGANGYNMVQELLWMERLKDRLEGKLVVWFAFYGNDLLDNLHPNFRHYRQPFVRWTDGEWEVVTDHVRRDAWPFQSRSPGWGYDRTAEPCCVSFQSERAYSACAFLIRRAQGTCHSAGANLAVMGIPDVDTLDPRQIQNVRKRSSDPVSFDATLPDRRMAEICRSLEAPFVALSSVLTVNDHLPHDCHWTPRGHGRVSRMLEELYRESGSKFTGSMRDGWQQVAASDAVVSPTSGASSLDADGEGPR